MYEYVYQAIEVSTEEEEEKEEKSVLKTKFIDPQQVIHLSRARSKSYCTISYEVSNWTKEIYRSV